MNDTATQQGAARREQRDPDVKPNEVEIRRNPRDLALEAMADRQDQLHRQEVEESIANDPGLAAQQAALDRELAEANARARASGELPEEIPSYGNDGVASRQPMHLEQEEPAQRLPSNLQDDPLADFIVMQSGKPMVKAKVNGQERLIPLTEARRQLQIGVAAEVRMQTAAQREKEIEERERRLTASEQALAARAKPATPAKPPAGLTDEDLTAEASDIFNTAFSGTEEDAAKKLARTLIRIRDSAARPTQSVDVNQIAKQAASLAAGTLTQQSRKKDVQAGFKKFKTNYPDIMADPRLFKMADDMTDEIEREHPDWDIAQVMDEAGNRTMAWVKGLSGEQNDDTGRTPPRREPGDQNSLVSPHTAQTRLERKSGLVRMPTPASGSQHQEPAEPAEEVTSPHAAFLDLKKARGQPV